MIQASWGRTAMEVLLVVATLLGGYLLLREYLKSGSSPAKERPERVVGEFLAAVAQGDLQRAYELTTAEIQRGQSLESWGAAVSKHLRGSGELVPRSVSGSGNTRMVSGTTITGNGPTGLKAEIRRGADGSWKVSSLVVEGQAVF
jgi:hypothetical protein